MCAMGIDRLDVWLVAGFRDLNTALEEAYLAGDRPFGADEIALAGGELVEGITEVPGGKDDRYRLLGSVGFYLAACYRHGAEPAAYAGVLATRLGLSLGVAPRYVFAHQIRYGVRTFTTLPDEHLFVMQNALGVQAYERAAAALRAVVPLGLAGPGADHLLRTARDALQDVLRINHDLADALDVDRFYRCIRPYFASHPVAGVPYRGVNAGDFAAINEIDLLLGLCRADDPFYQGILTEKYAYLPPTDQPHLQAAVAATPLCSTPANQLLQEVCRAHGGAYAVHHHRLVLPFVAVPAATDPTPTSSGPPLTDLLTTLRHLRDLRAAAPPR
jgi:hypothetical protein